MEGQGMKRIIIVVNPPDFDPVHVRPELVGDRLFQRRFALLKQVESDGLSSLLPIDLADREIAELEKFLEHRYIKASLGRVGLVRNSFIADCQSLIGNGMT